MSHHPPLVAPANNGDPTSIWFALRYVKNQIPTISAHELVQLVGSIGAETKDKYTFQTVVNATGTYKAHQTFPQIQGNWQANNRAGRIIKVAIRHNHRDWVHGFGFGSGDIKGSGGPSNVQKIAVGGSNDLHKLTGGLGSIFSGSNLLGIAVIVILLVVLLGKK